MSTVEERVKKVIAERLDVEASEINNNSSFMEDLGADSLDLVELVMDLETEFDCTIDDEDAEKLLSVQSAIDFINENI